jgi:dihydrofolate reductase
MSATLSIIAAVDLNGAIGFQNRLLFHLPADLKRFKALTTGNTVVMGRLTFESLPKGALPNRRNIVLTTHQNISFPGAEVYASLQEAIADCAPSEHIYIIGGASVYRQAIDLADELCLTEIQAAAPEADVYFPKIDGTLWCEKSRESHLADEKHPCPYDFVDYVRR